MSYRPMTTGAERISVLSQLRVVRPYSGVGAIRVGNLGCLVPVTDLLPFPAAGAHDLTRGLYSA